MEYVGATKSEVVWFTHETIQIGSGSVRWDLTDTPVDLEAGNYHVKAEVEECGSGAKMGEELYVAYALIYVKSNSAIIKFKALTLHNQPDIQVRDGEYLSLECFCLDDQNHEIECPDATEYEWEAKKDVTCRGKHCPAAKFEPGNTTSINKVKAFLYWYTKNDVTCGNTGEVEWDVICKVKKGTQTIAKAKRTLKVTLPAKPGWTQYGMPLGSPAYAPAPKPGFPNGVQVSGSGTLARNLSVKYNLPILDVNPNARLGYSKFEDKVTIHEECHKQQFVDPNYRMKDDPPHDILNLYPYYNPDVYFDRVKTLWAENLTQMISREDAEYCIYWSLSLDRMRDAATKPEDDAYSKSDKVVPKVQFQGDCGNRWPSLEELPNRCQ